MTAADERAAMVALLRTGRRPWVEYADLIEERESVAAVLADELAPIADELGPSAQTTLFSDPRDRGTEGSKGPDHREAGPDRLTTQARADLERWSSQGMHLVTVLDRGYPPNLRAVHDRPPMVFVAGHLTPADARAVAVVGARKASHAGIERAARDRRASRRPRIHGRVGARRRHRHGRPHRRAGHAGGRTVAVIGTGLARSYPPQNAALQRRIASECAVVSQFWPDSPPSRRSFPMRNAVMSGHHAGDRRGRGIRHERRADAGAPRARAGPARVPARLAGRAAALGARVRARGPGRTSCARPRRSRPSSSG